jgi:hypothetical protein
MSLGSGADGWRGVVTLAAPERNIAEKGIATDPLALKQEGERVIHDLSAGARQPQKRVPGIHRFPDTSSAPVIVFHRARNHEPKPIPFRPVLGRTEALVSLVPDDGLGSFYRACRALGRPVLGEKGKAPGPTQVSGA